MFSTVPEETVFVPAGSEVSTTGDDPVVFATMRDLEVAQPHLLYAWTAPSNGFEEPDEGRIKDVSQDLALDNEVVKVFESNPVEPGDSFYMGFQESLGGCIIRLDVVADVDVVEIVAVEVATVPVAIVPVAGTVAPDSRTPRAMMVAIPVAATIPVAKVTRQRGRPIASDAGTARTIEVGGAVAAFGPVAIPEITRERGWPVATHPWPVAAATWTVASQITRQRRGTIDVAQARAIATATTGTVPTDVSRKRGRPIPTATAGQARRRERGLRGRAEAGPIPGQRVRAANARTIPATQLPTADLARTRWQRRTVAESATGTARVSATKPAATGVASGEAVEAGLRSGLCRRQTGPTAGSTGSLRPGIIPWQSPAAARTHSAKPRARHAARKRGWRLRTCRWRW
jgi:hypothetical protein